jgi:hypothetical protein
LRLGILTRPFAETLRLRPVSQPAAWRGSPRVSTTRRLLTTTKRFDSTQSYQAKNLSGIQFEVKDYSGWDFHEQDLTNASFASHSSLTDANLTAADTRGAQFANLTGATFHNAIFPDGHVLGLNFDVGDKLVVRNYLGDPNRQIGAIPVYVREHMAIADGGILQLLFDTDPWESTISFEPDIFVELGGTLELAFSPEVELTTQVGRTLHIFNWEGVIPWANSKWPVYMTGTSRNFTLPVR